MIVFEPPYAVHKLPAVLGRFRRVKTISRKSFLFFSRQTIISIAVYYKETIFRVMNSWKIFHRPAAGHVISFCISQVTIYSRRLAQYYTGRKSTWRPSTLSPALKWLQWCRKRLIIFLPMIVSDSKRLVDYQFVDKTNWSIEWQICQPIVQNWKIEKCLKRHASKGFRYASKYI